jgi:uncharacterized RDD family membrane protein YckC
MKTAATKLFMPAVVLLVLFSPAVGRCAVVTRDLFAWGTDQLYWSADVVPSGDAHTPAAQTTIRFRTAGDGEWRVIGEVAGPVTNLSNRGSELLVVLEDGQWLIADGGIRTGIPLPGKAEALALAGDGDDIWAIAQAPAGATLSPPAVDSTSAPATSATASTAPTDSAAPATRRSTAPSSAPSTVQSAGSSTGPSTAPAFPPHDVGLMRLRRGDWSEVDMLPAGIRRDDIIAASLAMIDGKLYFAVATRDFAVRVFVRDGNGWDAGGDVAVLAQRGKIRLMNIDGHPALWMSDGPGSTPGSLAVHGQRWESPVKLALSAKLSSFDCVSLTSALGRIGLLASDAKGRLAEQLYKKDGSLLGSATEGITVVRGGDERLAQTMQILVLAVLLVWMMGSMRQRPAMQEAVKRIDQLHLAPLGRRLAGGMIDLLPMVVAFFVAQRVVNASGQPISSRLTYNSPEFAWLAAGVGVYLLHTLVMELLIGRSIGKLIAGMRVAALDGQRATASAILTRNLLRIVDLMLMFFPLSFVFFSPLRQRVGDMAGGTIVVMNDASKSPTGNLPSDGKT